MKILGFLFTAYGNKRKQITLNERNSEFLQHLFCILISYRISLTLFISLGYRVCETTNDVMKVFCIAE